MEIVTGEVININNEYDSYIEYKEAVDAELQKASESFVKIGYLLKVARDTDILQESGYTNVNQFAQIEYGLDKSQVSRFIRINDEYSEGGYSEKLQEKYRGYGYAKLALMLLLPAAVNEEISANYSKSEIQTIKEEIEEERKISDLEVMMEEKDDGQEELGIFAKVLHQMGRDDAELYVKLHEAVEKTDRKESQALIVSKLVEILAPNGEAIHSVRIPGEGRKMLSIKGADSKPTVIDIRSNQKEECTWENLIIDIEILCEDADAKKSWELLYGEAFPRKEKKAEVAPVQPKADKKKTSKVNKAKTVSRDEVAEKEKKAQEKLKDESKEEKEAEAESGNETKGQAICDDILDKNAEEHEGEPVGENEQLPGQMEMERDFPQYCPEKKDEGKAEVAPVQLEAAESVYTGTTADRLADYEDLNVTPEQLHEFSRIYLEKCEEVNRLSVELAEYKTIGTVEECQSAVHIVKRMHQHCEGSCTDCPYHNPNHDKCMNDFLK